MPRSRASKLAAARDALSHSHPGASDAEILEVGLDLVIEPHLKRRGITAKPRVRGASSTSTSTCQVAVAAAPVTHSADPAAPSPPPPKRSRHVPASVWRAVWERDGGRCAWPLQGGGVCGSTRRIELDASG